MHHYVEDVIDLLDPALNQIHNMTADQAREKVLRGSPEDIRQIDGSFALLARNGKTVRLARSMDRPMRYFLAKRHEGPALVVSDRIDRIYDWLKSKRFENQFHPSYTRMVPAHHVLELQLIGCPDPDPTYTRYFTPEREKLSGDLEKLNSFYLDRGYVDFSVDSTEVSISPGKAVRFKPGKELHALDTSGSENGK